MNKKNTFVDLTNQIFGKLLVIKRTEIPENSKYKYNSYWLCQCECGNKKIVTAHSLKSGNTKSCGCLRKKTPHNFKDLSGQRFGKLVILNFSHMQKNRSFWNCICDCGNSYIANGTSLKTKQVKSCGCWHRELFSSKNTEASMNEIFRNYIIKAEKRNVVFELTREDFNIITKQDCYYCGKEPSRIRKNKYNNGNYIYNGIDRIDSSKGYILENCVPCCTQCNIAKNATPQDEFINWIKKVYKHMEL
jgi:hypothetical protein